MAVKFTNNAATTLAAGINSSVTSIAVTDGSVFPTITGSDHFYVTFDDTTNKEIVKVTARSGNTLTVVRGHDNTTARAFSSGDKAELRIVAALLEDVKTEVTSTLSVDTFTSDGTSAAFTLSQAPSSEDNLIVFIEGVYQNPGDFTLSGTTLTLDAVPPNTRKVVAYHVSGAVSGNNLNHDQFTCNGSTTAFTLGLSPIHENNTQVFLDGVYQQKTDYAVSGTTLTMDTAPANGAILEVMTFTQTDVNTLPASFVSGLTQATAVGADHFMIFDATDSALKKSLVSDVLESATSISTSADATAITIDSNEKVTFTSDVTTGGHLSVGGNNNELRFYEGSNYVGFEAPALSADKIWVLPAADGSSGQVIKTDGSGNLSFTTIDTSISANSVGITELNVSDGSNGQVLTTDGAGTLSFSTVSGTTINNNADNRIITGSGTANTLEGESTLTYSTGALSVTGSGNTSISINTGNDSGDNSVINFGDTADADVGYINYDHSTNKMQFSANSVYAGTAYPQLEIGNSANTTSGALLQVTNYGNIGFARTPQYYGSEFYADFQAGSNGGCHISLFSNGGSGGRLHLVGGVSAHTIGSDTSTQINFTMNQSAIGNINTSGVLNIDVNDTSDQGLKENITSITDGTTVIKALRPVAFDWKEITAQNEKGETTVKAARTGQHGFLAQEIETVLPNAVEGTDWVEGNHFTDSKSMNSAAVLAHAVKAIQELEARIETLENA